MSKPVQEFTFQEDTEKVIEFFMGEHRFRVIKTIGGGNPDEPIQITLAAIPVDTGDWGIIMLVEFLNPEHVVSRNSRTLKVAMIRLSQVREGECHATLEFLDDGLQVQPKYRDMRKRLHDVAQGFALDLWRGTRDEWLKRQAKKDQTPAGKC